MVCASLFGYNKNDMVGKKVTCLMPTIYSQFHDTFIENYLSSNESKFLSKDRILFGIHHSNYIFPIYLNVRVYRKNINSLIKKKLKADTISWTRNTIFWQFENFENQ